jgi:hypothetical protein
MELTYVAVVILASMVFVLSGMVGYLYWQQTRMLQHLQSLAVVISTQLVRPAAHHELEHEHEHEPEHEAEQEAEVPALEPVDDEEDDRLTVEKVEGPPAVAPVVPAVADDLDSKTSAQLRDLLTERSIPFNKRDSKPTLVNLLKATA